MNGVRLRVSDKDPKCPSTHKGPGWWLAGRTGLTRGQVLLGGEDVSALGATEPVNPAALAYVNRLSDYLFVLTRAINAAGDGDVLWVPGGERGRKEGDA